MFSVNHRLILDASSGLGMRMGLPDVYAQPKWFLSFLPSSAGQASGGGPWWRSLGNSRPLPQHGGCSDVA